MSTSGVTWPAIAAKLREQVKPGEQKEVALALGISPGALSRYLSGERVPSDPVLAVRLCTYLGVDLVAMIRDPEREAMTPALAAPLRRLAERLAGVSADLNDLVAKFEGTPGDRDSGKKGRNK